MKHISLDAVKKKLERGDHFILINALDEPRFNNMHIPGSVNIYRKEDIVRYLRKDDEIIVYCTDVACNRSILLYQLLTEMGYTNVHRFAGGLRAWVEAGYPVSQRVAWDIIPMYTSARLKKAQ